jgi:hypothetical protein|tara:strand:+ start:1021 stop:1206 length:186 start_codon:yes stop_codon:yes gene_type:complete
MKRAIISIALAVIFLSSCGVSNKLTDKQQQDRAKIDFEINKLWNKFEFQRDSLVIEYYKIK